MSEPPNVKSTWSVDDHERPSSVHHVTMLGPASHVCNSQCPWLIANCCRTADLFYDHEVPGIPSQRRFTYAPWKRARIWNDGLKDGAYGYGSLCHVRLRGTTLRDGDAWDVVSRQCSGVVVMQQREALRHVEQRASALTPEGAARVVADMLGRPVAVEDLPSLDIGDLLAHAHPSLLDPNIGSEAVAPQLSDGEIDRWRQPADRHMPSPRCGPHVARRPASHRCVPASGGSPCPR